MFSRKRVCSGPIAEREVCISRTAVGSKGCVAYLWISLALSRTHKPAGVSYVCTGENAWPVLIVGARKRGLDESSVSFQLSIQTQSKQGLKNR